MWRDDQAQDFLIIPAVRVNRICQDYLKRG